MQHNFDFLKKNYFVDLKSNSALLYNKGHNFWKVSRPKNFPKTEYFSTKRIYIYILYNKALECGGEAFTNDKTPVFSLFVDVQKSIL